MAGVLASSHVAQADTNVKVFTTSATSTTTNFTGFSAYNDWNKIYHRVVTGPAANTAVFYNRYDYYFRVMHINSAGGYSTLSTVFDVGEFDEVLTGNFVGATAIKDLLFFNRATGWVKVYELHANGQATYRFSQRLPPMPSGGKWDIITSGYLGQSQYRDDILLYNKTEGVAKFYRLNSTSSSFAPVASYWGWQRNWDQIVPGDINGDSYTDFLFYNQDGGSRSSSAVVSGHAKFVSFGSNFNLQTISETVTTWPMAAHVMIVPGNFGGDSKTDFLVYNADQGTGTFWWNTGAGQYAAKTTSTCGCLVVSIWISTQSGHREAGTKRSAIPDES
ncbi:MAG: hypothetical protein CVU63_04790 [Deltaproteobacteria bacterium HGW-Deltaproteobacteria-20]|nr:MAG: hypothetical protein CVU63_04790 [Deltaproteobacteria bacterium HGW-Deltaproteobacteria-20]